MSAVFTAIRVHGLVELQFPTFLSMIKPFSLVELSCHPKKMWFGPIALHDRFDGGEGADLLKVAVTVVSSSINNLHDD